MIKEVEERQMALDMRLPNASKLYFYEACLITMRAIIRLAHRYAELAREMAAKEKNATRKAELIAIAETCEWVPEHPARNLREAIQCHFFCHICAEIEQVGCGYSEAYLGQNFEPFYQRDKAAGLIGPEEATFMLKNLFIKLNEIGYYYGEKVALQNSADLGQSISLGGFTEDGEDATAEMDYLILDACRLSQSAAASADLRLHGEDERQIPGKGPRCHRHRCRHASVRERRCDDQAGPAICWPTPRRDLTLEKARRTCVGACVGSYIPYETGHPVEGQPNLGKVLELTMNNGFDPRTKKQIGPKTGDPENFKNFEELYAAFEQQLQFCEDILRRGAWIASMLTAEFLPVTWRSLLTKGCIETGTEIWNGGANYYTVAQISVGGVDAANGLMAVKNLVFDEKKLTMAELKKALAANFEGKYEKVGKLCYEGAQARQRHPGSEQAVAPGLRQHPAGVQQCRRRWQLHQQGHQDVARCLHQERPQPDGHGDRGAADRQESRSGAHRWKSVGHAGYRCQRTDRAGDVCGQGPGCRQVMRHAHEHEAPAGSAQDPQGPGQRAESGQDPLRQRRLSHPVQCAGHRHPQGRAEAPGELPRPRGPGGRVQRLLHQAAPGVQNEIIERTLQVVRVMLSTEPVRRGLRVTPYRPFLDERRDVDRAKTMSADTIATDKGRAR